MTMRFHRPLLAVLALLLAATPVAHAQRGLAGVTDAGFLAFLPQYEAALAGMLNGDGAAWLAMTSTADDATLFSPFGLVLKGADAVRTQYGRAAVRHLPSGAVPTVEYLAAATSGPLAYVVVLERTPGVRLVSRDTAVDIVVRATHVFRREGGAWRLLHRHMDHLFRTDTTTLPAGTSMPPAPPATDPSFRTFLARWDSAMVAMLNGDAGRWNDRVARDPTLFTPFGLVRRGREAVTGQFAWAAARTGPDGGALDIEYLAIHEDADLAVTVAVERNRLRMRDRDTTSVGYVRATQVFRREDGAWVLAHRHMDHVRDTTAAPPPPR
jgi:ketosteroid isomerase-like protein